MASTYSDLKVELIGTGEQTGTWGATTNNNLSVALGEAITGSADVTFTGADVTLTLTDTNAAQTARNLRLNLTGTSGGARNLILGSGCQIEKLYLINNGLADAVTVKNTTGNGVAVPAGRSMFVFNNGTDVVEASSGDIFGPASSTLNAVPTFADTTGNILQNNSGVTISSNTVTASGGFSTAANLTFTGTGNRITGDFSNATSSNRVLFQTSTTNGQTATGLLPNGTSTQSQFAVYNGSDPLNASQGRLLSNASEFKIENLAVGTGTYLPMTFYTGGSERLRIDTSGRLLVGTTAVTTSSTQSGEIYSTGATGFMMTNSTAANYALAVKNEGTSGTRNLINFYEGSAGGTPRANISLDGSNNFAFASTNATTFSTASAERMRIDSSGRLLVGSSSSVGNSNANNLEITNPAGSGVCGLTLNVNSGSANTGNIYWRSNASNNAIQIVGDPISNYFAVATAGAERMRIDSSGNVLVGATGVRGGVSTKMLVSSSSATNYLEVQNTSGAGASGDADVLFSSGSTGAYGLVGYSFTSNALRFFSNSSERMRIDSSGNVGIGTTSPVYKLVVSNAGAAGIEFDPSSGVIQTYNRSGTAYTSMLVYALQTQFYTGSTPAERMRITSTGLVGIGNTSPSTLLTVGPSGESGVLTTPTLRLQGYDVLFGSYGGMILNCSNGQTSSARRFMVTNALDSAKFGIIRSTNATTDPALTNSGVISSGTADFVIDNVGNVGIGTTSPSHRLQVTDTNPRVYVRASSTGYAVNQYENNNNIFWLGVDDNTGSGFNGVANAAILYNNGATPMIFSTNGTERMRILANGDVGIGTSSPAYKLQIGTGGADVSIGGAPTANGTGRLKFINSNTNKNWQISTNDTVGGAFEIIQSTAAGGSTFTTPAMLIDSSGNVGIGTSSPSAKLQVVGNVMAGNGTAATPAYHFVGSSAIGMFTPDAGFSVAFSTSSTERMRIHASGGVSIGNTTDSGAASLNVSGSISGGYIAHAAGTTAMAFGSDNVVRVTPNATATYTTTVPAAGAICVLSILTSGTTSYTITFGTGFKSTGTLATGTVSARYFNITFVSDGTNLIEMSRTVAIA